MLKHVFISQESNNDSDSVDVMDSENQGDTEEALDKEEERHVDEVDT